MAELLEVFVLGGYPRTPRARHALRDLERGVAASEKLARVLLEENLLYIGAQIGAGLKVVQDPVVEWQDILRPFALSWRGVYVDGLLRYFDNNFFYRVPVFIEKPDPEYLVLGPRVAELVERLPKGYKLKVVLPGPLTFVKLSKNRTGLKDEELVHEVARALSLEASKAVEAGASVLQVDEPWLVDIDATRGDAELAKEVFNKYFAHLEATKVFSTYFDAPKPEVLEAISEVKAEYVAVDVADSPAKALKAFEKYCPDGLALGVIQARDIYEDPYEKVEELVRKVLKLCAPKRLALTTSSWLDLIPYDYAIAKTRLLASYAIRLAARLKLGSD